MIRSSADLRPQFTWFFRHWCGAEYERVAATAEEAARATGWPLHDLEIRGKQPARRQRERRRSWAR